MNWETRRKFLYALATIITLAAVTVYLLRDVFFPLPTCFDKKQNGYEIGVDCGGTCSLRCSSEVAPLSVLWTRVIRTSSTTYDIVGMVSNKNINSSARNAEYIFTVYNDKGQPVQDFPGVTLTPVSSDFPIVVQSIKSAQILSNATLTLKDGSHYTVHEKPVSPTLSIGNEKYEEGSIPRVYVTVQNKKRITVTNLPIKVILFDQDNNAYAVGQTIVPELNKEESKVVSFTWDAPLPYPPTRIRAYTMFDPFLPVQ